MRYHSPAATTVPPLSEGNRMARAVGGWVGGECARAQLPWLERMGWGREAEVEATVGGELLGLTEGAAESLESSVT